LKPLRDGLLRLRGEFEFGESRRMPIFRLMETILEGDIHWWDNYSLKIWCDKILFEDLRNHFPDLAKNLEEVEKRIRHEYPEFYKNIISLLKEIYSCKELEELSKQIVLSVGNYPNLPYDTVFLIALGYDKGYWLGNYNFFKEKMGKLDLIYELGNKYKESESCKKAREIRDNIESLIDSCTRQIDEILYQKELKGKCNYM
jgi:hypothetical protein